MTQIQFWRLADFLPSTSRSRSMLYEDQKKGLFPTPIQLGGDNARASSYLAHEVNAVLVARAAGQNDEQVKALVTKLKGQRAELLEGTLAQIDSMAA
ncbi:MAG: helix-turn-helix transcriptional regulator [Aestuariibacter sp.]